MNSNNRVFDTKDIKLLKMVNKKTGDYFFVDSETFEIYDGDGEIYCVIDKGDKQRLKIESPKRWSVQRKENPDFGDFTWFRYANERNDLDGLDDSDVARLMVLATKTDYYKTIVFGKEDGRYIYARWDTIGDILNICDSESWNFRKATDGRFIKEDKDGNLILVAKCFKRGRLSGSWVASAHERNGSLTRMYAPGVMALYRATSGHQKSLLCYMYKLLPYVSVEHNILCWNPKETDINNVNPLSVEDVCDLVGYSKTNARRFKKILTGPEFSIRKRTEHAFVYIGYGKERFCLNPHIFFAGSKESASALERLF